MASALIYAKFHIHIFFFQRHFRVDGFEPPTTWPIVCVNYCWNMLALTHSPLCWKGKHTMGNLRFGLATANGPNTSSQVYIYFWKNLGKLQHLTLGILGKIRTTKLLLLLFFFCKIIYFRFLIMSISFEVPIYRLQQNY